jgi:centromere-localized protein 2
MLRAPLTQVLQLFGSDLKDPKLDLNSILEEMGTAAQSLEKEIEQLQEEEQSLTHSVQQTVGKMSDLRYGRFENVQLRDQVYEGLSNLQEACKRKA